MDFMSFSKRSLAQALSLTLAVAFFGSAGPASSASIDRIQKRGVLEVCVNPNAMPFSKLGGGESGLHLDLANAFARELGVSAKFSWVQYRFQAKYTKCDAFMGIGVLGGEDDGPVKKTKPFLRYETVLVTKAGKSITKLEDLDGLRVALQSGSLAHVTLLNRPVDVRVSLLNDSTILDAVDSGEIDVGVVSNIGLEWYLKNNPDKSFARSSASVVQKVTGYPMAAGMRKADSKTMSEVNSIIDRLIASGEMQKIMAKYGLETALIKTSE
jgi:ABC-type amino acid transport substrate-binding protein